MYIYIHWCLLTPAIRLISLSVGMDVVLLGMNFIWEAPEDVWQRISVGNLKFSLRDVSFWISKSYYSRASFRRSFRCKCGARPSQVLHYALLRLCFRRAYQILSESSLDTNLYFGSCAMLCFAYVTLQASVISQASADFFTDLFTTRFCS